MSDSPITTLELRLPAADGVHSIRAGLRVDQHGELIEYFVHQCSHAPHLRILANGIEPLRVALEALESMLHLMPKARHYLVGRLCPQCDRQMAAWEGARGSSCYQCQDGDGPDDDHEEL